jgi:hypothetical protein
VKPTVNATRYISALKGLNYLTGYDALKFNPFRVGGPGFHFTVGFTHGYSHLSLKGKGRCFRWFILYIQIMGGGFIQVMGRGKPCPYECRQ